MISNSNLLAYIPARAGSKRLPGKNIKVLGDRPVIAHVIGAIKESGLTNSIYVSTDSPEVAKIAEAYGAQCGAMRAAELADDHTNFPELLSMDVPRFIEVSGVPAARCEILFVLPTAGLLSAETLRQAHSEFRSSQSKILFSTVVPPKSPYRMFSQHSNGEWTALFPEFMPKRSQDLPQARADAGQFYFLQFTAMANLPTHWFCLESGLHCFDLPPHGNRYRYR